MYLITTALKETFQPRNNTLFLGEWCIPYTDRKVFDSYTFETLEYHWDNRNKLANDYKYLNNLYESILLILCKTLNKFHEKNYSDRFWRILVGPWLIQFIHIFYDRWYCIQKAYEEHNVSQTSVMEIPIELALPNCMEEFRRFMSTDIWNHYIYGLIITALYPDSVEYQEMKDTDLYHSRYNIVKNKKSNFMKVLKYKFLELISMKNEVFIYSQNSYIPHPEDLRLLKRIKQTLVKYQTPKLDKLSFDLDLREEMTLGLDDQDQYTSLLGKILFKQIPTTYLEGFKSLESTVARLRWPIKPKLIIDSNGFYDNDILKHWTAKKVEEKSKFIISQHGGHYGTGLLSWAEDHELKICDKYLSWGWRWGKYKDKVIPFGSIRLLGTKNYSLKPKGGLLLVSSSSSRYSCGIYSMATSSNYLSFYDDLYQFYESLGENIQERTTVRMYPIDYSWNQKNRWQDKFPLVKLDNQTDFSSLIESSRLFVSTYNAFTFLETLARNKPTIMFWNPEHWELNFSAQKHYDLLIQAGILHRTAESASQKIIQVWENVEEWWETTEIQDAVSSFCTIFAKIPKSSYESIDKIIIDELGQSNS